MFDIEEKIISGAAAVLEDEACGKEDLRQELLKMLKGYKRIYKQLRRVIKISDSQQEELKTKTIALTEANNRLQQANYQLSERQNIIIKLLGDISKIKISGDKHAMRNLAQRILESQKKALIQTMARQIYFAHELLESDKTWTSELHQLCRPFGITDDIISDRILLENRLHEIEIDKPRGDDVSSEDGSFELDLDVDDLLGDIFDNGIYFDEAYKAFQDTQSGLSSGLSGMNFNPFILFVTLKDIKKLINEINLRFSGNENIGFLEPVKLSEAMNMAGKMAKEEKGRPLDVLEAYAFDPEFLTNKESLIFMMRDFLYNSIDAGADRIVATSKRPSNEKELPYFDHCRFEDFPSVYISLEDNGSGR